MRRKAGKRLGKDAAAGKATFVSLLGLGWRAGAGGSAGGRGRGRPCPLWCDGGKLDCSGAVRYCAGQLSSSE